MKTFLFFNFYKDDVITNLADTVPGNNVFIFASEKTAEFTGDLEQSGNGMRPVAQSNSRSMGQPRLLQVQVLMISFCRSSQSLIKIPFLLIYEYFLQIYMSFC